MNSRKGSEASKGLVAKTHKSPAKEPAEIPPVTCPAKKYVFDLHSYVWKELDTLIRVVRPSKGLGRGGMRVCYDVEELDEEGRSTGMVAKMFRRVITDVVEKDYFNEGEAQCMCEIFANSFNRINVEGVEKPNISFLQCYVVRIPRRDIPKAYQDMSKGFFSYTTQDTKEMMFVMEPKLTGRFTKYNSNYGGVYREEKWEDATDTQTKRRSMIFEAAESFSHFTLAESGGSMLVCDLQGVNDLFTDPQIHTEDGKGLGMGNMGQEGIAKWVENHCCNALCKSLGLQPLGNDLKPLSSDDSKNRNYFICLRAQLQRHVPLRPQDLVPLVKPLEEMTENERFEYVLKLSELTS
ncbi:unnamed protein product [Phytomonas sp. EM1]|nr:unnamed protein product [Phytomonas sp. EM1]|eukprot:CCW63881.1 unnamed protein product [Phytomonas sp. isolate EM1]